MASSQGIRAGQAFVELFADDSKLVRGLKAAEKRLKAFGAGVQSIGTKLFGLGAATVAPLLGAANVFNEFGSQLDDMSQRTGISAESASALGYAAKLSGTDLETLEGASVRCSDSWSKPLRDRSRLNRRCLASDCGCRTSGD